VLLGQIRRRMLGVVAADHRALFHLGDGGRDRLPHLQRDRARVGGGARLQDLRRARHPFGALRERPRAVDRERGHGALQLHFQIVTAERLERGDRLARGRVHTRDGHVPMIF
jgi:hypothetical protein